jgi:hypothetical protein
MEAESSDDSNSETGSSSGTSTPSPASVSALLIFNRIVFEPFLPQAFLSRFPIFNSLDFRAPRTAGALTHLLLSYVRVTAALGLTERYQDVVLFALLLYVVPPRVRAYVCRLRYYFHTRDIPVFMVRCRFPRLPALHRVWSSEAAGVFDRPFR